MAVYESRPLKRTSSTADFETPASKKLNRGIIHHQPTWDPQRELRDDASWQDEEAIRSLLTRSIVLALEAVGFEAAAPNAIESFCLDVEEYMAHYLADVRQSMLSCRRTTAIPQDFLQALHTHQLSLRSLLPHLCPPIAPQLSQLPLQAERAQDDEQHHLRFLGPILNSAPDEHIRKHVPNHFPAFPSKHTYKATPDFPERENDPRKIRERATQEGRLGEEALRRLVGAGATRSAQESLHAEQKGSTRARRNQLWMETMQAVASEGEEVKGQDPGLPSVSEEKGVERESTILSFGNARLGSPVNAEKRYWRKPARQR